MRKRVENALLELTELIARKQRDLKILESNEPRRELEIAVTVGEIAGLNQAARLILDRVK